MEMSHLEVLNVWSLNDAPNPRSSWGSLSPTWDQDQWRPWLSDTKDGAQRTNSKCGHSAKRSLSPEGSVLPSYHGGGTGAGCCRGTEGSCQAKAHLKRSCNRGRISVEKTLISYDMSCIPRAFGPCLDPQYEQSVEVLPTTSPDTRWALHTIFTSSEWQDWPWGS